MAGITNTARVSNDYITTCGVCRFGIYKRHKRIWVCKTIVGLIHEWCEKDIPCVTKI